jgi:hypothetical protein
VDEIAECDNLKMRRRLTCADSQPFVAEALEQRTLLSSYAFSTLYSFPDGAFPRATTVDSGGNVYGMAYSGGPNGSVWELAKGSNTLTTLFSFPSSEGPGSIIVASGGNLYGIAFGTTGALVDNVWELPRGSSTINTLYSIPYSGEDGGTVNGLTVDSGGDLYGTVVSLSGTYVWELANGSSTLTTLASVTNELDCITIDSDGNLYGDMSAGIANDGAYGFGAVWELAKGTSTVATLYSFTGGADGIDDGYGIAIDGSGNLYGLSSSIYGNANTVWELINGSSMLTTLYSFTGDYSGGSDGASVQGIAVDTGDSLYGLIRGANSDGAGTVFELTQVSGISSGPGAQFSVTGSPGAQLLDVTAGTITLTQDLSTQFPNYALQVENGASVVLASDQHIGALQLLGSGSLDMSNYTMFINYGSNSDPITTIAGYIKSGYNGGGWNGQGIISTAAQTPTNGLYYGLGYADGKDGVVSGLSVGQIEIKYTLLGDANLDGLVNGSDFNILAANFNQSITGWDQGDFNYDGLVNAADFNELAANFNQGASGASVASSAAVLDVLATPVAATTPATVTTSTIESTANTTATPAAAATAPKVTTSTTSAARNMTAAPAVISAPLTVATVTTRSTAAAPPASKSKPVGVSKAVIANGKSTGSVMTTYAASVVTVPTSGSMATPQNTNDKDAKFLAHG